MLCKVTHCAGHISANTRPHQLCWGDREMGTTISCIKCSQVAGFINTVDGNIWKIASICVAVLWKSSLWGVTYALQMPMWVTILFESMNLTGWPLQLLSSGLCVTNTATFVRQWPPLGGHLSTSFARVLINIVWFNIICMDNVLALLFVVLASGQPFLFYVQEKALEHGHAELNHCHIYQKCTGSRHFFGGH